MRSSRWAKGLLLFLVIGPIAIIVFGGVVMLLWNNVLAEVVNVSKISFWQALGIFALSKILFGNFSGGGKHSDRGHRWKHRMQEKWANMTAEEKERFKERWKHGRCGYKPWEHEGHATPATVTNQQTIQPDQPA